MPWKIASIPTGVSRIFPRKQCDHEVLQLVSSSSIIFFLCFLPSLHLHNWTSSSSSHHFYTEPTVASNLHRLLSSSLESFLGHFGSLKSQQYNKIQGKRRRQESRLVIFNFCGTENLSHLSSLPFFPLLHPSQVRHFSRHSKSSCFPSTSGCSQIFCTDCHCFFHLLFEQKELQFSHSPTLALTGTCLLAA